LKKLFAVQAWLLLLIVASPVPAATVRDLYASQVPVEDQSEGSLSSASRGALAEVLVKVSGHVEVLENPDVAAALREARRHVLQYAYVRDEDDAGALQARFEFDSNWVVEVLTAAGEPLWTANRPLVLVWMVAEDSGGRYFVNHDSSPELANLVLEEFGRRGVPVRLPLFDLADSTALAPEQAWRLEGGALEAASARYDVENFIAGRMAVLSTGGATGDWSYFSGGDRSDRAFTASSAEEFITQGVSMVAESMASRYAVAPTRSTAGGITLSVQGVQRYADYARIVAWLQGLELVEHANLERVSNDLIEIRLIASAAPAQIATLIELNQHLAPLPPQAPHIQLSYQWLN
jgi:hypothetical protein